MRCQLLPPRAQRDNRKSSTHAEATTAYRIGNAAAAARELFKKLAVKFSAFRYGEHRIRIGLKGVVSWPDR
jgi:hypothetical protein